MSARVAGQIDKVRRATERFRSLENAREAGYELAGPCVAEPRFGGMGIHAMDQSLATDQELDVRKPEVLVYDPGRRGSMRLVAVEYLKLDADGDVATSNDLPGLFGRPFDGPMAGHAPGEPAHYDLHAWVWKRNPSGMFAQFNPRVSC